MQKIATLLTTCAAALALAACSSQGGSNPVAPAHVATLTSNVLQMNVGTANLFGDTPGAAVTGTNVFVTYRQPSGALNPGASAVLVSTPTLTLPHAIAGVAGAPDGFNATIAGGPAPAEIGTTSMTATAQSPTAANVSTFGNDGGAFGLGLEPFNYAAPIGQAGVAGAPANVVPYAVPLYDAIVAGGGVDPNAFIPGGGPPAFNPANNQAAVLGGFNAISEGLDVFGLAPTVGAYTLSVLVPANSGAVTQSATASVTSAALLPAFTSPVPVVAANGSVTAVIALPAGVTEAYIQLTNYGPTAVDPTSGNDLASCVGAGTGSATGNGGTPMYNTVVIRASGTATFPAGTVCTAAQNSATTVNAGGASDGDAFTVQAIGFDYGAYEASYTGIAGVGGLGNPAPTMAGSGASHQSDVTVSSQGLYNQPIGGGLLNGAGGAALPAGAKRVGARRGSSPLTPRSASSGTERRRLRPAPFCLWCGADRDRAAKRKRDADPLHAREAFAQHERRQKHRCSRIERGQHGDDREQSVMRGHDVEHVRGDVERAAQRNDCKRRPGEPHVGGAAERESAGSEQHDRRGARGEQRHHAGVRARLRERDEVRAEAGAGDQRFRNARRKDPRALFAVGRFYADEHDGDDRCRDAGNGDEARTLAANDEAIHQRNRRAEHGAGRRYDAHRADRQSAVETCNRNGSGDTAGRAPKHVGRDCVSAEERQHAGEQHEAEGLRPDDDAERRRAPAGEPAEKIRRPVDDRRHHREDDRHRSARVRIERFAQSVTEQVEAENERGNRQAGKDQRPGRGHPIVARIVEHRAPLGGGRPRTQA